MQMSIDQKSMRKARARLQQLHAEAEEEQKSRENKVYSSMPRIRELDTSIRFTMLNAMAYALSTNEEDQEQMQRCREENQRLQEERTSLLISAHLPASYLDDLYYCSVCKDTGFLRSGKMCKCLEALYKDEQRKELSTLLKLGNETFDTFSLDWYSNEPLPGESESPREIMDLTYEACFRYAQSFSARSANLLLTGSTGLGKTFLSACIARVVFEKGFSVVYETSIDIFSKYETVHFGRDSDLDSIKEDIARIENCDLLILDDLGTEMVTAFTTSTLYSIINGRLISGKKTIISTNFSPEELHRRYNGQIYSRIAGEYQTLRFCGKDIRLQKKL